MFLIFEGQFSLVTKVIFETILQILPYILLGNIPRTHDHQALDHIS